MGNRQPKRSSTGLDTILVLDTSYSMNGRGLEKLKEACHKFIQGVEQISSKGLPENIGIVEFGRDERIIIPLTNEYNLLHKAVDELSVGGSCTPTAQGLLLALKEIGAHGGVLNFRGVKISPRIILMTDGNPTEPGHPVAGVKYPKARATPEARLALVKVAHMFGPDWESVGLPFPVPIALVGVGNKVDNDLLRAVAKVTNGMYVQATDLNQLSEFFLRQVLLIQFLMENADDIAALHDHMRLVQFMRQMGQMVEIAEALALLALLGALVGSGEAAGQGGPGSAPPAARPAPAPVTVGSPKNYRFESQDPQSNAWVPYPQEQNDELCRAYAANPSGTCTLTLGGNRFTVDFSQWKQTNAAGRSRNVRLPGVSQQPQQYQPQQQQPQYQGSQQPALGIPVMQAQQTGFPQPAQWYSQDPQSQLWIAYDPAANSTIEAAHAQRLPSCPISLGGTIFTVDFASMQQKNSKGFGRPITRRP